jgi:hypothetical protein
MNEKQNSTLFTPKKLELVQQAVILLKGLIEYIKSNEELKKSAICELIFFNNPQPHNVAADKASDKLEEEARQNLKELLTILTYIVDGDNKTRYSAKSWQARLNVMFQKLAKLDKKDTNLEFLIQNKNIIVKSLKIFNEASVFKSQYNLNLDQHCASSGLGFT